MIRPLKLSYVFTVIAFCASDTVIDIAFAQQSSLSDQCIAETEALATNQAITSNVPSAECTINLDISNSCTTDFEPVSGNLKDACLNGGGRFYTTDVNYDCSTFAFGENFNANYTYLSFPACVGVSCTDEELKAFYSSNVHPYMEESFAARGLICDMTGTDEMGNPLNSDASAPVFFSWSKYVLTCLMFVTAIIAL